MSSVQIPEEVATMAGGPEPIGPPGQPPLAPPGPGGPPPDLAALLGGGGGAPMGGPGGPPMGGPGEEMNEPPGPEEPESEIDVLSSALDTLMQYLQIASDDIEKAKAMKAANIVQDLLASNQKEAETAGGIGPAQRGMRKALGG